jgi:hypothetical protein
MCLISQKLPQKITPKKYPLLPENITPSQNKKSNPKKQNPKNVIKWGITYGG